MWCCSFRHKYNAPFDEARMILLCSEMLLLEQAKLPLRYVTLHSEWGPSGGSGRQQHRYIGHAADHGALLGSLYAVFTVMRLRGSEADRPACQCPWCTAQSCCFSPAACIPGTSDRGGWDRKISNEQFMFNFKYNYVALVGFIEGPATTCLTPQSCPKCPRAKQQILSSSQRDFFLVCFLGDLNHFNKANLQPQ